MRLHDHRWLLAPIAAVVAMSAAAMTGGALDELWFRGFVHGLANPPFFIEDVGNEGTTAFRLRTLASRGAERADPSDFVVVALADDADGVFQSFPHAPVDLALVFRNMERHGARRAAIGAVLAWENPDPFGLIALNRALDGFSEVVTSVPLTRGATAEPLPAAFRRASLDPEVIDGDLSALPVVNRAAIADAVLGGENALAGFTSIEPSSRPEQPPLLARWDDRVVLAFPLLAALQQVGAGPDDLEIRLGSHIRAGAGVGLVVPIDSGGRLAVAAMDAEAALEIEAGDFFDREFAVESEDRVVRDAWLLRDDRSMIERVFRGHSAALVPVVAAIEGEAGLGAPQEYHRLPWSACVVVLAGWLLLLMAFVRIGGFSMEVGLVTGVAGWIFLQWAGFALASVWLPGVAALAGAGAAWLVAKVVPSLRVLGVAVGPVEAPVEPFLDVPLVEVEIPDLKTGLPDAEDVPAAPARKNPDGNATAKKTRSKRRRRKRPR